MAALSTPKWVRWWFRGAAVYGVLAVVPLFLAAPGSKPETFYGFAGTALVFQLVFWVIGGAPQRHRALMPLAIGEKLAFAIPVGVLWLQGRVGTVTADAGLVDAMLAVGFAAAWRATPPA